jgi:voltage-gated potassium channel
MFHEIMAFFDDLLIAATLILLTCIIHGFGLDRIMGMIVRHITRTEEGRHRRLYKIFFAVVSILGIFLLVTVHIWLWALTYELLSIPEFKTLEDAVYFSTVTFTTLGYGDIVLHDQWRVLSGIEAANGVVLLGWSTAFLFEIMQLLYPRRWSR